MTMGELPVLPDAGALVAGINLGCRITFRRGNVS